MTTACASCGREYPEGAVSCGTCGRALPDTGVTSGMRTSGTSFVGRQPELETLSTRLEAACAGSGRAET